MDINNIFKIKKQDDPLKILEDLGKTLNSSHCYFHSSVILRLMDFCVDYTLIGGYLQFYRNIKKPFDISFKVSSFSKEELLKDLNDNQDFFMANSSYSENISFNYRPEKAEKKIYFIMEK